MNVYPVQSKLMGISGQTATEIIAVCSSLSAAQMFVARRAGQPLVWTKFTGHGVCWHVTVPFRINAGPPLANEYSITEHEVQS